MRDLLVTAAAVASATFVAMPPAEAAFVVRDCGGNVIKVDYKKERFWWQSGGTTHQGKVVFGVGYLHFELPIELPASATLAKLPKGFAVKLAFKIYGNGVYTLSTLSNQLVGDSLLWIPEALGVHEVGRCTLLDAGGGLQLTPSSPGR